MGDERGGGGNKVQDGQGRRELEGVKAKEMDAGKQWAASPSGNIFTGGRVRQGLQAQQMGDTKPHSRVYWVAWALKKKGV